MNRLRFISLLLGLATSILASDRLLAAPAYTTEGGEGLVDDLFDISQGSQVIAASPQHNACCGESDPRAIFGWTTTSSWVEPTHAIFQDGAPVGTVDTVEWQTAAPVNLTGVTLRLQQDGPNNPLRAATAWRLFASPDGMTFSRISGGTIPGAPGANRNVPLLITDRALTGVTDNVRAFRLELNRASSDGVRVVELDGEGTLGIETGLFLDRLAFNAASNRLTGRGAQVADDEGPGLATGFTVSSRVLGTDTVEDAFGNANGAVEPESFIFGDGGTPDNGNDVIGDGGETVDFIEWQTKESISLAGYRLTLSGDGADPNRSTELVRFLVDGDEADFFDNQGFDGTFTRVFKDGARWGGAFRIEFTRTTASGPRIIELDAITGPPPLTKGELVLNEIVSLNAESLKDEDGDSPDWIELFNGRDKAVPLAGWGLSDNPDRPFRWMFPAVTMPPRSYLVVFASGKDRRVPGVNLHTSFQLQSDGEFIVLTEPDGTRRDLASPARLREDVSLARHPNGTGEWKFLAIPTPRRSNNAQTPYDSIVFDGPRVSHSSGFYPNPFDAVLTTSESQVTVRYTLDGSEPTETSTAYEAPLSIRSRKGQPNVLSMIRGTATANQHTDGWKAPLDEVRKATVVRARATRPRAIPGPEITRTYFVGAEAVRTDGLPTIALTTAPDGLFDYHTGIYMLGEVFDRYVAAHPGEALTGHTPANYTQRGPNWERNAYVEWFEPNGQPAFAEPVVIDIQGQSSRSFRQKSFGLKARGTELPRNTFLYPIFPNLTKLGDGSPLQEFRHLRLRNMGNDWDYALMRDDWCHRLASGLGLNIMSSRYANLYLDGEYWGVLAVREQEDSRYVQEHYGVDDDEVVILTGPGTVEEGNPGDEQPWLDLLTFCQTHDLSIPTNYDHVAALVDPQDTLSYFFSEIYFGNADWPQNNTRVWRRRLDAPDPSLGRGRDGRWRWLMFDVDLGVAHPWSGGVDDNTLAAALSPTGRPGFDSPWGTAVFRALMTNPGWKQDFLLTAADLLNSGYSPTRAAALVDAMRNELRPAMDEHIRRWRANGGNVAAWETRVRPVRDFATQRTGRVRSHFLSQFGLHGQSRLTLDVNDPIRGRVRINRLVVDASLPGVNDSPYPWTGIYFNGVPVTIEALPTSGWQFAGWSGLTTDGPEATWIPGGNLNVTAQFMANPPSIVEWALNQDSLHLLLSGTPGATYAAQVSSDLIIWSDAAEATCGPEGGAKVIIQETTTERIRFVRALSR
ncbi:MAG TPA: CotH kinase family protein [Verrucomicrobiota bacterium]|nr:hypothetical protein [Verrucomicrobiales bacterium]HRI15741.1 CotH kinase family protein [Verrucomicrobiota bacterium]